MPCRITKTKEGNAIQCGSGPRILSMNMLLNLSDEGCGCTHVFMGKLNITDTFKDCVALQEIEDLAIGWPGQKFSIEMLSMMSDLKYERKEAGKWVLVKDEPGMAAY